MAGVFIIDKNFKTVISKDAVSLTEHLKKLSAVQLMYIVLVYDYSESPYRRKPVSDRKRMAIRRIWPEEKDFDPEEYEFMEQSIKEYKSLIFDNTRYTRDIILNKKQILEIQLEGETDGNKMANLIKAIDVLDDKLDDLEMKIDRDEESIKIKGDKGVSLIERFMRNRTEYLERAKKIVEGTG